MDSEMAAFVKADQAQKLNILFGAVLGLRDQLNGSAAAQQARHTAVISKLDEIQKSFAVPERTRE